jgi:hypothetical protein
MKTIYDTTVFDVIDISTRIVTERYLGGRDAASNGKRVLEDAPAKMTYVGSSSPSVSSAA